MVSLILNWKIVLSPEQTELCRFEGRVTGEWRERTSLIFHLDNWDRPRSYPVWNDWDLTQQYWRILYLFWHNNIGGILYFLVPLFCPLTLLSLHIRYSIWENEVESTIAKEFERNELLRKLFPLLIVYTMTQGRYY